MMRIGLWIYAACVDFMIQAANLLGVTYRDTNALLFFVVWPAVTVVLVAVVLAQHRTLKKLQAESTAARPAAR
ncbi:MAG: hypothetical protein R3B70_31955 [Polyangiaceae bacterium]